MNDIERIQCLINMIGSEGYKDGSSTKVGWTYQPILFEEFMSRVHKPSVKNEFSCIESDLGGFRGKSVLDIGCANGYFAFSAAGSGARRVVGYEADTLVHNVNEEIRKYKGIKNVEFYNQMFDMRCASSIDHFDVIIMLNVHMWIHKQNGSKNTFELMATLRNKCDVMYFQTAHSGSGGGYKVPELKNKNDIGKYLSNAGFSAVECINLNERWFNRFMFRCTNV